MSGFLQHGRGGARGRFTTEEAQLVSGLALQVAGLLDNREGPGTDPAVDRLLPDGYRDNDQYAVEFRRFTEEDLATAKITNALLVSESLSDGLAEHPVEIELDARAAGAWLRTLTDMRLALAVRLGIDDEAHGHDLDDQHDLLFSVYDWLGLVQESLVAAVDA